MVCARILAALAFSALALPAFAEADRGQELYETHCINCHTAGVHVRERRMADDFNGIRLWASRWNENLALGWGDDDILEVALYLNRRFYNFPCPTDVCKLLSSVPPARAPQ